jgi:hypothetical protein
LIVVLVCWDWFPYSISNIRLSDWKSALIVMHNLIQHQFDTW